MTRVRRGSSGLLQFRCTPQNYFFGFNCMQNTGEQKKELVMHHFLRRLALGLCRVYLSFASKSRLIEAAGSGLAAS